MNQAYNESRSENRSMELYETINYDELWLLRNSARDALRFNEDKIQRFMEYQTQHYNTNLDYVIDFTIRDYYGLVNLALDKMVSPTMNRNEVLKVIQPRVIG